jgi:transcriptional regulator with XRE-family HTH domain
MPGLVIKKYREMRNYSQKYVAAKMGMSQNAYSKIENNITGLTVQHVKELSKILEIPISDLLKDEFEIHKPFSVPRTVTKADLTEHVNKLQKIISDKHAKSHESYIVAMSLILAAEGTLASVH